MTTAQILALISSPVALLAVVHLLHFVFTLVHLPKVADAISKYAPTITALLPAVEDVVAAPNVRGLNAAINDLEKLATETPAAAVVAARLRSGLKAAGVALACFALASCSAAQVQSDITAGVDIADAVCSELAANLQTEPEWVRFVCTAAQGVSPKKTFAMRIPKTESAKFAAKHCVKSTGGAPTP